MEKSGREIITRIGEIILKESDVVGTHGTSIKNAESILENGLIFKRTSIAFPETIVGVCTYGWKETYPNDSANVVISIPKSFFMDLIGFDEKGYFEWIKNLKEQDLIPNIVYSVSNIVFNPAPTTTVPKEFVRGMFTYTDGKTYLQFLNNFDEAMDYLSYKDNPYFYNNLTKEEKEVFIKEMRKRMFSEKDEVSRKVS